MPVVTVIDRGPDAVPAVTVNCAVSIVALTTFTLVTVIPAPPLTCDELLKFVFCPTIVTVSVWPAAALDGDAHTTIGRLAGSN